MSWNRSNGAQKPEPRKPSATRRIITSFCVVGIAALAAFFFFDRDKSDRESQDRGRNTAIKDAKTSRDKLKQILDKKISSRKTQDAAKGGESNTAQRVEAEQPPVRRNVLALRSRKSLFSSMSECQIDGVVNTPLGSNYYDDEVPEEFEEDFAYSLTNRIVITEDDTPEEATRKRRVIEAKEALVALKKQGADLRKVMLEQKKILIKKFEDYTFFEQGLTELRKADASPEEIAEYAVAAKKMMQEKEIDETFVLDFNETAAMEEIESLIDGAKNDPAKEGSNNEEVQK